METNRKKLPYQIQELNIVSNVTSRVGIIVIQADHITLRKHSNATNRPTDTTSNIESWERSRKIKLSQEEKSEKFQRRIIILPVMPL